jgi:predicted PurR-regulated permease PerM
VFSAAVKLIAVLSITFFLLLDGERLTTFIFGLMKPEREARWRTVARQVYGAVAGYVAGNLIISVVAGLVTYATLELLGVPFAVPLSVLVAFLDLIPLVGATIGAVVVGLVTLFVDFPTATIVWIIVAIVYQQAENHIVQPIVYRETVDVRPLVVIVSILIGAALLGVLGALVAIPVAATVQIILRDWWERRQQHRVADHVVLPSDVEPEPE